MSMDTFNACVKGYEDRLFDLQVMSVQTGYWAAYYNNARHPKPIQSLISDMIRKRGHRGRKHNSETPDVDVAAFLERERQFKERLNK